MKSRRRSWSPRAVLATSRATRRATRTAAVIVTALGCVLVGVGAISLATDLRGTLRQGSQPGEEQRVPASEAVSVYAAPARPRPEQAGPAPAEWLRAGDIHGGAVTYLKFEVPDTGRVLGRGLLELTSAEPPLPGLVELVAVPDTTWQRTSLSWSNAPLFGRVVRSVHPEPEQRRVVFDVTDLVAEPGVHAFAVTAPPDLQYASFAGAGEAEPVLRLSWWADPPASPTATPPAGPTANPSAGPTANPSAGPTANPSAGPPAGPPACELAELLVPTCGLLWGVAPGGHTGIPRTAALDQFEQETGRKQDIYHAYHRGRDLFPTTEEARIAAGGRLLFLNWKPQHWTWAQIAGGDPGADAYLDRLAAHINATFTEPFFFTVHHEPENDVRPRRGSGWEPADYAAMYRHVVERLRGAGVDNLVSVMNYMAYVPWNAQPWFPELYPGDDVVDWIAWNAYAYSDPGYGYGDFGEMMNRRSGEFPDWPGFYTWATTQLPNKPYMLGEWGVWHSPSNPGHMVDFYDSVARQTPLFPRVKALVYFDTPGDQRSRDSRPSATGAGLEAYRRLGAERHYQVRLGRTTRPDR